MDGAEQECSGYLLVLAVWKHNMGETRSLGFSPGTYLFSHFKAQGVQRTAWVLDRAKAQTTALSVSPADALDMALLATQIFPTKKFLPDCRLFRFPRMAAHTPFPSVTAARQSSST